MMEGKEKTKKHLLQKNTVNKGTLDAHTPETWKMIRRAKINYFLGIVTEGPKSTTAKRRHMIARVYIYLHIYDRKARKPLWKLLRSPSTQTWGRVIKLPLKAWGRISVYEAVKQNPKSLPCLRLLFMNILIRCLASFTDGRAHKVKRFLCSLFDFIDKWSITHLLQWRRLLTEWKELLTRNY